MHNLTLISEDFVCRNALLKREFLVKLEFFYTYRHTEFFPA